MYFIDVSERVHVLVFKIFGLRLLGPVVAEQSLLNELNRDFILLGLKPENRRDLWSLHFVMNILVQEQNFVVNRRENLSGSEIAARHYHVEIRGD
jgi:hypothetical protein